MLAKLGIGRYFDLVDNSVVAGRLEKPMMILGLKMALDTFEDRLSPKMQERLRSRLNLASVAESYKTAMELADVVVPFLEMLGGSLLGMTHAKEVAPAEEEAVSVKKVSK